MERQDTPPSRKSPDPPGAQYDAFTPLKASTSTVAHRRREHRRQWRSVGVSRHAYQLLLSMVKPAATIDGITGDQRFFLGWAQTLARAHPRRSAAQPDPDRPALTVDLSLQRLGAEHGLLVRRVLMYGPAKALYRPPIASRSGKRGVKDWGASASPFSLRRRRHLGDRLRHRASASPVSHHRLSARR